MKIAKFWIFLVIVLMTGQACNTLYNTKTIHIEVLEPSSVKLPEGASKIALRYNNSNVAYNPVFSYYFIDSEKLRDTSNLDSLASWIYYDYVIGTIIDESNLESVTEIAPGDFSQININDTLPAPEFLQQDSFDIKNENSGELASYILSVYLKANPIAQKKAGIDKKLDPDYGLYSKEDIAAIADSTHADLLLSLDHFSTTHVVSHSKDKTVLEEQVRINSFWSCYDLRNQTYLTYITKTDSLSWFNFSSPGINPFELVPPRRDAVLNASDVAGVKLAQYLLPHWLSVERFYYRSGHVELKKTDKLVEEGKWLEAANIWKTEIDNKNKSIGAKCMYNLAVASEMQGNYEAALDWVVRSYHVYGEKNDIHAENCRIYINILAQRKVDRQILDQFYSVQE